VKQLKRRPFKAAFCVYNLKRHFYLFATFVLLDNLNMRAIGFSFQKGKLRVAALDQNSSDISYHASRTVNIDPALPAPELMERYATQVRTLIGEFLPDIVAVREVWESKNIVAAMCQVAPVGIVAYICHEKTKPFFAYTPQALRQPKPFGLAKGVNPINAVDEKFGDHPPYWDDLLRSSLLVAWRALLECK
jgi:hypothetical protein